MPESAQQQVQADVNAMQSARNDLNNANTVVANSRLTPAQKAQIHTQLATVAGVLQTAETAAQTWLHYHAGCAQTAKDCIGLITVFASFFSLSNDLLTQPAEITGISNPS